MGTATIREVQHNLAAYVRRAEQGEEIVIRRRNRTVARLAPLQAPTEPHADVDWGELRTWRRMVWGDKPLRGKPVSELVYESRGDR